MTRRATAFAEALLAVALVTWMAASQLPLLGLASAALLFLLPVLLAAVRGGLGPGLVAALGGAACYNFFLIEPRYTLQVHRLDNLVSVFVLGAVALVTSRLASRLTAREAEARARARLSEEAAALSALLAAPEPEGALQDGIAFIEARYGPLLLLDEERLSQPDGRLSALDLAAAAWALHNGDGTGHGTPVMTAADWSVLPLRPARQAGREVLALTRPADGRTRPESELHHLRQLALLIGQCRDRAALEAERRAREGLEERDRLRRTLLASLAHDFRTPLTIISGRLAELASERPDARDALVAAAGEPGPGRRGGERVRQRPQRVRDRAGAGYCARPALRAGRPDPAASYSGQPDRQWPAPCARARDRCRQGGRRGGAAARQRRWTGRAGA